ncbi:MAG: hypothetical protein A2Y14_03300 [Verrucomicrobia bacterium GWF2_51_19]|nr:MAG: hypothetical protein A2Y14_03300 [Verrucomicrobia bacterium GWF2_51_19]
MQAEAKAARALDLPAAAHWVTVNNHLGQRTIDPFLEKQGVRFEITDGEASFPSLGSEEWMALTATHSRSRVFLYIPKNVRVERPIILEHSIADDSVAIFPQWTVVLDEGAEATLVDLFLGQAGLCVSATACVVKERASLNKITLQSFHADCLSLAVNAFNVAPQAKLQHTHIATGCRFLRSENTYTIANAANVQANFLNVLGENQCTDIRTLQCHKEPKAISNVLCKNILNGNAHGIFNGSIDVRPEAVGTQAYQKNQNWALSSQAKVDTMPSLEIKTNDVSCSHGASVGSLDSETLFYLQSRGIEPAVAAQMLAMGFAQAVLEPLPTELKEYARSLIEKSLLLK